MESERNRKIREILEMFKIDTKLVIGEWNIIGHLANAFEELKGEHLDYFASMVDSYGFKQLLLGKKELKDK